MDERSTEFQTLTQLGENGATAFLALTRIALSVAQATPGGVGRAKHILLDHLAEMPADEKAGLYAQLVGVAVAVADTDPDGGDHG